MNTPLQPNLDFFINSQLNPALIERIENLNKHNSIELFELLNDILYEMSLLGESVEDNDLFEELYLAILFILKDKMIMTYVELGQVGNVLVFSDFFQEGFRLLEKALTNYDPLRGSAFSSFFLTVISNRWRDKKRHEHYHLIDSLDGTDIPKDENPNRQRSLHEVLGRIDEELIENLDERIDAQNKLKAFIEFFTGPEILWLLEGYTFLEIQSMTGDDRPTFIQKLLRGKEMYELLFYFSSDLPIKKISELTGVSTEAIYKRLQRAPKQFMKLNEA